jgi:hypothetical protein
MWNMKLRFLTTLFAAAAMLASPWAAFAADAKPDKKNVKPYTLKTCPVTDEEISDTGDMKPYAFTHEGREIKLCCKSCLKKFNKDAAKYIKKIEEAEKKAAK